MQEYVRVPAVLTMTDGIVYFCENSGTGYTEWERVVSIDKKSSHPFLDSEGNLSRKKIERELNSRYESCRSKPFPTLTPVGMVQRLPSSPKVYDSLAKIDKIRELV